MTLEEWLDRAIAENAAEARDARRERTNVRAEGASARDLQERLRATAGTMERRVAPSAFTAATASESTGSLPGPAGDANPAAHVSETGNPAEARADSHSRLHELDVNSEPAAMRTGGAREPLAETRAFRDTAGASSGFDLDSAVSQIASRRRALDAHVAHDGLESLPRKLRNPPPDGRGVRAPPIDADQAASNEDSSAPEDSLRLGLHVLSAKLEALRREWSGARAGERDLAALQDQIADMRRSLLDLAPRKVVAALTNSLGDLAERVSALDRFERGGTVLLAPLDRIANELREALSVYDPKAALTELERRIDFVGARIDAVADAIVRPEVVEAVRRQMQEVHDLLLSAARRSIPIERVEGQISRLVDRVERLTANTPAGLENGPMTELLAALCRQDQGSAATPVLNSIERRLEDISGRLDHEIASRSLPGPELQEFDAAAGRIAAALRQSQDAATRVEASVNALNAKLEPEGGDSLAALICGLGAKFDAAEVKERGYGPIAPILSEIVERLDRLPGPDAERESGALRSIDHELKSLRTAVEASAAPAFDRLAEDLTKRLDGYFAGQPTGAVIFEQFTELNGRLDAISDRIGEAGALERAARDLIETLRDSAQPSQTATANTEVAERLSAFRQERAEAERRTEALLQGIQEVLDRLIDRIADDDGRPLRASLDRIDDGRSPAARTLGRAPLAGFEDIPPRPLATPRNFDTRSENATEERLLEPGAGAPQHIQVALDLAQTIGSRTNPAVSAHIAAARRAAQTAAAETRDAKPSAAWPRIDRNLQHARRFCAQNKRSLLLGAALVLAVAATAILMDAHAPLPHMSELDWRPSKPAAAPTVPIAPSRAAGAVATTPATLDATPIGSIGRTSASGDDGHESAPRTPELSAAIPNGAAPSLREAVLAGSPAAQYDLAQRLLDGRGLSQDQAAAAFWFDRAASAGFAPAEFRLGALYQKGVGVQRDPGAAKRWYTAAARSGNARAAHNLGVMDAEPVNEKADYAEAAKWFRRAAEMGVRDSQFNLAVLYARGLGVEQDLRQSWMWFSLAAAQGDSEAARKRDEVAARMDPGALTAAADQLAKFKAVEPDPTANDVAAMPGNSGDKAPAPTAPASRDQGPGS